MTNLINADVDSAGRETEERNVLSVTTIASHFDHRLIVSHHLNHVFHGDFILSEISIAKFKKIYSNG